MFLVFLSAVPVAVMRVRCLQSWSLLHERAKRDS